MIKSMYSAVSGIKSFQTKMDVIGNNIANVNTTGFKSSRVVFKDLFYQTLSNASAPSNVKSGISPRQVGLGAAIANIDIQNTRTGMEQTDRALDLYISGDGYFTLTDGTEAISYTRVGSFNFDVEGNLVDSSGSNVCGLLPDVTTGEIIIPSSILPANMIPIKVTDFVNYSNISVGKNGIISGIDSADSNQAIKILGQIVLAKFPNAEALLQDGNLYNKETLNSGSAVYVEPGLSASGTLTAGGLEMSNVDLSKEFTDMIVTQRGLQANARVITTSDEILQELVGLKR
ncbi:MAG TPA: flagellar hook-basal body complex protein [Clostridia bacterium]|nr:flagellar hook-basal body complex protein [Clostridia bacterium]